MNHLSYKLFVVIIALLSFPVNAKASWQFMGNCCGNQLYVSLPPEFDDADYGFTSLLFKFWKPAKITNWKYKAYSITANIKIDCDIGSVKFGKIVALSNPRRRPIHQTILAFAYLRNGVKIKSGTILPYNKLPTLEKEAVDTVCEW